MLKKKGEILEAQYEWYWQQYINAKGEKAYRRVWRKKGAAIIPPGVLD